jgi:hypothetical protein
MTSQKSKKREGDINRGIGYLKRELEDKNG